MQISKGWGSAEWDRNMLLRRNCLLPWACVGRRRRRELSLFEDSRLLYAKAAYLLKGSCNRRRLFPVGGVNGESGSSNFVVCSPRQHLSQWQCFCHQGAPTRVGNRRISWAKQMAEYVSVVSTCKQARSATACRCIKRQGRMLSNTHLRNLIRIDRQGCFLSLITIRDGDMLCRVRKA